ncbi:hypothetical protein ZWY2020_013502 [Hordeum vulgare]|nr:hypothetical protein ZWY2020_013502 [Hordeum vulgare]
MGSLACGVVSRRPQFLFLHGFRTSDEIMLKQVVGNWPSEVTACFDLVFTDAPFPSEGKSDVAGIFDPPYYECSSSTRIAATFKAKINRKRLDKLDIIKICEEILNPSVPTALRPSKILMGEPPLGDYYLAAFLAGFALPSYSNISTSS